MTAEEIFEQLGLTDSSDEFKQEMLQKIVSAVEMEFTQLVDELLDEEQKAQLEKEIDKDDPEAVATWMESNLSGVTEDLYGAVMQEHVQKIKDSLGS